MLGPCFSLGLAESVDTGGPAAARPVRAAEIIQAIEHQRPAKDFCSPCWQKGDVRRRARSSCGLERRDVILTPINHPDRSEKIETASLTAQVVSTVNLLQRRPVMNLVGTCMEFCPTREAEERTKHKQIDPQFERDIVIKRYARSAAGRSKESPENVRPPQVLLRTVEYLLTETVKIAGFPKCYPFIWDRLWAVRQDLTFQQSACVNSRKVLVRCVRFYTVSKVLCSEDIPLSIFDPKINDRHLIDTLGKLVRIYDEFGIEEKERPGMESLWLLLNIHSPKELCRAYGLPETVKSEMIPALKLSMAFHTSNSYRFLRMSDDVDILQWCILSDGLNAVRLDLLRILNSGFSSKNCAFPLTVLCEWLRCGENDCKKLLELSGIPMDANHNVNFLRTHPNCEFTDGRAVVFREASRKNEISDSLSTILLS